ncbi:hypothetical protein FOCC_FOCC002557 [Frankliniella occidentalis]|nr:hypothetical protein FOCC_FOCC002557 [Frankliniella occidentalis]
MRSVRSPPSTSAEALSALSFIIHCDMTETEMKVISTADVCIALPVPSVDSPSTHAEVISSSDSKWTWTIKMNALTVPFDRTLREARVYLSAIDKSLMSSTRLVKWGGSIEVSMIARKDDCYGVGKLPVIDRPLQTFYEVCRANFYTYSLPQEFKITIKLEVSNVIQLALKSKPSGGTACLLKSLDSFLLSGLMSDVKLCTEGQEIPAHRIILAARSEFFKAKFKPEWDGNTVDVNLDLPILEEMLRYMYTGSFGDDVDLVKLLIAADMYLVSDLREEVTERLKHNLSSNINNAASACCNLLKTSAANNSPSLWIVVLHYLKSHRDQVLKSKEWGEFQKTDRQTAAEAVLDMYNLPD